MLSWVHELEIPLVRLCLVNPAVVLGRHGWKDSDQAEPLLTGPVACTKYFWKFQVGGVVLPGMLVHPLGAEL